MGHPVAGRMAEVLADADPGAAASKLVADLVGIGPLIEPVTEGRVRVTFLLPCSGADSVSIQTPLNGASPMRAMTRVPGSDVWYATYETDDDIRTTYQFCIDDPLADVELGQLPEPRLMELMAERFPRTMSDPSNPRMLRPEMGGPDVPTERWSSVLVLPRAAPTPWAEARSDRPHGAVERHFFASEQLGNERRVWVYTPPGYDRSRLHPVVMLLDGRAFRWMVDTDVIVDNLIAAGHIDPPVVAMIDNATATSRMDEYDCKPAYAAFIADELLPWLRTNYGVALSPDQVSIGGASYGGLGSAFVAWHRPDAVGNVLSFSGSFWYGRPGGEPEWLTTQIAAGDRRPVRWWLNVGRLEAGPVRDTMVSMISANRHLRTVLQAKGYDVTYTEFAGGHEFASWGATLPDALRHVLR